MFDAHTGTGIRDGHQQTMCALPANPVECPNELIPSLVRLDVAKEREDIRRQILDISTIENVLKIAGGVSNGEVYEDRTFWRCTR